MHTTISSSLRIAGILVIATAFALALAPVESGRAGGCLEPYVVEPGDTLESLAADGGYTAAEIAHVNPNRFRRGSTLVPGDVLCLPLVRTDSRVRLTATYQFDVTSEEQHWDLTTVGGEVGLQHVFALQPYKPVQTISSTSSLESALFAETSPMLMGRRNCQNADCSEFSDYTLVTIGSPAILASLQLTPSTVLTESEGAEQDVLTALGFEGVIAVDLTLWAEGDEGSRFPFHVTKVAHVPTLAEFQASYLGPGETKRLAFALLPSDYQRGTYRLALLLTKDGLGPPNETRLHICRSFPRNGGIWFRVMRAIYGCR